jgi:flagellar motor switch protein FliN
MTDDRLSPDEIEELLGQNEKDSNQSLSVLEKEALAELLHITFGSSSEKLSHLVNENVTISTPQISILLKKGFLQQISSSHVVIPGSFQGSLEGTQFLMLRTEEAKVFACKMLQTEVEDNEELTEREMGILKEAGKQIMEAVASSMGTVLSEQLYGSASEPYTVDEQNRSSVEKFIYDNECIRASYLIKTADELSVTIEQVVPISLAKEILRILTNPTTTQPKKEQSQAPYQQMNQNFEKEDIRMNSSSSSPKIQSVQFSSFDDTPSTQHETRNLNMLLDIPLQVTVELGRTKRIVKDILDLSPGSIVELDKLAGEPVDILVNNKLIAKGEVVVIDENFGVRVTDILSTVDRISKLR